MEGRTARQVGTLAEDDVLPAESREPVEDGGAADASADDDRPRTPFHANTLIRDLPALCRCSNDSMRTSLGFALTALLAAGLAGAAQAAGGPSLREDAGLTGIATPTGFRYVAIGERNRTVLARISPHQRVVAVRFLAGRYTIAGVAYDGTATGLSADGKTLVLVRPRFAYPRAKTDFLIVSTPGLHVRDAVTLRGDFSLDAVSPDGSMLYFIQYLSRKDPTEYAVRAFDREGGRLVPEPVVDKSEPGEEMRGNPVSRATSSDGRWAYTLYDGGGKAPFVHALDTVAVAAHCIDLDALAGRNDLPDLRLRLGNGSLAVVSANERVAVIDTASFQVGEAGSGSSGDGTNGRWPAIGVLAALLAATAASLMIRRRRRPSPV
jgi:hypothetical protein